LALGRGTSQPSLRRWVSGSRPGRFDRARSQREAGRRTGRVVPVGVDLARGSRRSRAG
jgi:hypothetical protein